MCGWSGGVASWISFPLVLKEYKNTSSSYCSANSSWDHVLVNKWFYQLHIKEVFILLFCSRGHKKFDQMLSLSHGQFGLNILQHQWIFWVQTRNKEILIFFVNFVCFFHFSTRFFLIYINMSVKVSQFLIENKLKWCTNFIKNFRKNLLEYSPVFSCIRFLMISPGRVVSDMEQTHILHLSVVGMEMEFHSRRARGSFGSLYFHTQAKKLF